MASLQRPLSVGPALFILCVGISWAALVLLLDAKEKSWAASMRGFSGDCPAAGVVVHVVEAIDELFQAPVKVVPPSASMCFGPAFLDSTVLAIQRGYIVGEERGKIGAYSVALYVEQSVDESTRAWNKKGRESWRDRFWQSYGLLYYLSEPISISIAKWDVAVNCEHPFSLTTVSAGPTPLGHELSLRVGERLLIICLLDARLQDSLDYQALVDRAVRLLE